MAEEMFRVDATADTPLFILDPQAWTILIKGVAMPENAFEFFDPLEEKALAFAESCRGELKLEVQVSYLNSMSGKQIFKLIRRLTSKKPAMQVLWKYAKGDDLIRIKGEEIGALCSPAKVEVVAAG
jgi:hypothetical protein